jgi:hypothetical protein
MFFFSFIACEQKRDVFFGKQNIHKKKEQNLLRKITTCKKFVSIKMRLKSVESSEEMFRVQNKSTSSNKKNSHIHKSRGLLTGVRNENGFMTCSLFVRISRNFIDCTSSDFCM